MANPISGWNSFWGKAGGELSDIYSQVRNRRQKQRAQPKNPMKPVTGATDPKQARKQLAPKPVGQTAGQKRSIYQGLEKDLQNP